MNALIAQEHREEDHQGHEQSVPVIVVAIVREC